MRSEYDLPACRGAGTPTPSAEKQVTIRLGEDVIAYFKEMADETHPVPEPDQPLPPRLCANQRRLAMNWS